MPEKLPGKIFIAFYPNLPHLAVMGLKGKQLLFVKEYLVDKNATRAAIAAGYSKRTARSIGQENLTKPDIAAAISEGLKAQTKDAEARAAQRGITKERWLKELELIAFANMDDFVTVEEEEVTHFEGEDDKQVKTTIQKVKLVPTMERKRGRSHVIKKITETTTQHGGSLGIELHNKIPALELIGQHYGWVKDESSLPPAPGSNVSVVITLPSNGREPKK